MGEYQYYEFCSLNKPLSKEARQYMRSLSSRARVSSHGASYVYNHSDFRGAPKQILLKYFDVFFYISNWGIVNLMFKYPANKINFSAMKKHTKKDLIAYEKNNGYIIVNIVVDNEGDGAWIEGDKILPDLLPLYDELKVKDYRLFDIVVAIDNHFNGNGELDIESLKPFSEAQQALVDIFN